MVSPAVLLYYTVYYFCDTKYKTIHNPTCSFVGQLQVENSFNNDYKNIIFIIYSMFRLSTSRSLSDNFSLVGRRRLVVIIIFSNYLFYFVTIKNEWKNK